MASPSQGACLCGCGEHPRRGKFVAGHDQRAAGVLIRDAYGTGNLAEAVEEWQRQHPGETIAQKAAERSSDLAGVKAAQALVRRSRREVSGSPSVTDELIAERRAEQRDRLGA